MPNEMLPTPPASRKAARALTWMRSRWNGYTLWDHIVGRVDWISVHSQIKWIRIRRSMRCLLQQAGAVRANRARARAS